MADNEFVGSALYASWVTTSPAGTVLLNTEFRNFNYAPSVDLIDATAGADASKRNIVSFKSGQITCTMLMQNDMGTPTMNSLAEGVSGTLTWAEVGTATGKPKHVAGFISNGYSLSQPYNDIVVMDITLTQNSARVDSVY